MRSMATSRSAEVLGTRCSGRGRESEECVETKDIGACVFVFGELGIVVCNARTKKRRGAPVQRTTSLGTFWHACSGTKLVEMCGST